VSLKQERLEAEDAGWRALCARLDRLSVQDWERPGAAGEWTPKHVVAHIACWQAEAVQFLEVLREGGTPRWPDVEEFNAEAYAQCRDMTLREVQAMSGAARHRFREEIVLMAEPIPDKHARAIANCGENHYAEHGSHLDAFLESL